MFWFYSIYSTRFWFFFYNIYTAVLL